VEEVGLPAGDDFEIITVECGSSMCDVDVVTTVVPNCTMKLIDSSEDEF
jgi:hypothetical protein